MVLQLPRSHHAGERWVGWSLIHTYPVEMAQNFWTAIYACAAATLLTVSISLVTPQRKTDDELKGLVYSMTPRISEKNIVWYKRTNTLALLVLSHFYYFIYFILVKNYSMLDIKIPIGLMFFVFGVILTIYGFITQE